MLPVRYRGLPLIALSSLFFAAMAVSARTLSGRMPVGQQVLVRFVIGLLAVLPFYLARRRLPEVKRFWPWFLRGFFGGGAVYLYFVAIEQLEVGPATLLNCMAPLWAAVFAALFLREKIGPVAAWGMVIATAGAGVVAWSVNAPGQPLALGLGVGAGIASAVLSGAAQTVIKSLRHDTDAVTVFLSFCLFGALFALPVAVPTWQPLTSDLLWPALALGGFSVAGQLLFTYAFKYTTATAGSAATQLTPAVTWVMGVAYLGESVSPLAVGGAVICVAGVIWGTGMIGRRVEGGDVAAQHPVVDGAARPTAR